MEPFVKHRGRIAVLDWTDVNTDLIIPARYLKRVERIGYGPLLFADKRYAPGTAPEPDSPEQHGPDLPEFPLNDPRARGAEILVAGRNFGCGSSREHAVWAVAQGGYRVVITPGKGEGFADIFEGNAYNNGLLPLEVEPELWRKIADLGHGAEVTIDLENLSLTIHDGSESVHAIDVPEEQRTRLLQGLDAVGETLVFEADIRAHEQAMPAWLATRPA
ncbi:MAG: 3-isopropylmalate dehydratase small subunit [Isosphaeraceae bacterium]|nr:3-isopropylmalate dehydratase small subunit [Isosphaeraceae bacterium]